MKLWKLYESLWVAGDVVALELHMLKTSEKDYSSLFTTALDYSGYW